KNLLLQLREGDHRAFEQLDKQHSRQLLAMLDKRFADPQEVDDILQELFVKVWERRASGSLMRCFLRRRMVCSTMTSSNGKIFEAAKNASIDVGIFSCERSSILLITEIAGS